jgi:hypothetical protein
METKIVNSKLLALDNQTIVFKHTESSWKATSSTRASTTAGDKSGHESGPVRDYCFLNVTVRAAQHTRRLKRNENLAFLL